MKTRVIRSCCALLLIVGSSAGRGASSGQELFGEVVQIVRDGNRMTTVRRTAPKEGRPLAAAPQEGATPLVNGDFAAGQLFLPVLSLSP